MSLLGEGWKSILFCQWPLGAPSGRVVVGTGSTLNGVNDFSVAGLSGFGLKRNHVRLRQNTPSTDLGIKIACLLQWIQGYHRHCYRWQWWSFCWAAKCCVCVVELRFSDAQWKKNLRGSSVRGRRRQGRSKSFQVILPVFFSQIGVLDGTGTGLTINTAHHLVKHWVCHLRCWMDSTEGLWGLGNANSNAGSWWSQRVDIQEKAE